MGSPFADCGPADRNHLTKLFVSVNAMLRSFPPTPRREIFAVRRLERFERLEQLEPLLVEKACAVFLDNSFRYQVDE